MAKEFELKVKSVSEATEGTFSITFEKPANFNFFAGQFLIISLDIPICDEKCFRRSMSIASSPTEDFLIITARKGTSAYKRKMETLKEGETARATGPWGKVLLEESFQGNHVMIAGGVGITPFRSMIKDAKDRNLPLNILLLYSNRVPETIAFKEELDALVKSNPNFNVIFTISDANKTDWTGETNLIDADFIKKYNKEINNSIYYLCGPPVMVQTIDKILKNDLKIDPKRVKKELFTGL